MPDGVRLSDLVVAQSRRGTPLPLETALFIALAATDAARVAPSRVVPDEVLITSEGELRLVPPANHRGDADAALRSLADLTEAIALPAPPGVRTLIARVRSGAVGSLDDFAAELEALLVPLNRAAARRVLGRLAREPLREPAVARPAAAATDTIADESAAGIARGALDTVSESLSEPMPRIPPPPRLGSLARLADAASLERATASAETERDDASRDAADTEPDGDVRRELDPAARAAPSPRRALLAVAGAALLLALAFLLYQLGVAQPGN